MSLDLSNPPKYCPQCNRVGEKSKVKKFRMKDGSLVLMCKSDQVNGKRHLCLSNGSPTVFQGFMILSMVFNGYQWYLINNFSVGFPFYIVHGSPRFSMVLKCFPWFSRVLKGFPWFSMSIKGSPWFSGAIFSYIWPSLVIYGPPCFSMWFPKAIYGFPLIFFWFS